jgi:hypothetical protein
MFTSYSHQVNNIHDEMPKKLFAMNLLLFHFILTAYCELKPKKYNPPSSVTSHKAASTGRFTSLLGSPYLYVHYSMKPCQLICGLSC